jgi:Protein of unknown function (DUF4232)
MSAPFDPRDRDEDENTEHHLFDDPNSMTWGAADPEFDDLLRERLGPMPSMPTPPYAFERVLVAGRRRRARKVWAGAAAAAFVVMAGTAGTTVALNTGKAGGPVIGEGNSGGDSPSISITSPSAVAKPTPTPTPSATAAATTTSTGAPTSTSASPSASVPECASDSFTLSVSTAPGSSGSTADALIIVLTNTSGHSCTTYGYPGLQLETASGQLQSTTVTRIDKSAVQHLTVAANASISTTSTYTAEAAGSTASAGCGMPSYSLAVIPPNQKQQIVQTINGGPVTVCGNGVLDTTPLVPGSTGS